MRMRRTNKKTERKGSMATRRIAFLLAMVLGLSMAVVTTGMAEDSSDMAIVTEAPAGAAPQIASAGETAEAQAGQTESAVDAVTSAAPSVPVAEEAPDDEMATAEDLAATADMAAPQGDEAATHRVTFYNADGTVFLEQDVADGKAADIPASAPAASAGKTAFSGWFLNAGGDTPFDFATPITGSLDLHAVFSSKHVISFKNEAGEVYQTQSIDDGGFATLPSPNPTSSDDTKSFQFWYIEGASETAYDFLGTPVYSNVTLVPKFSDSHYVFFETGGGTSVSYAVVKHGSPVSLPAVEPTRTGYKFSFWSKDPAATYTEKAGKEYAFTTAVEDTFTLHAIWQPEKVAYSIVYWVERANFAGDPGEAPANYIYSATKDVPQSSSTLLAGQQLSAAEVKTLAETGYSTLNFNANKPLKYSEFRYAPAATVDGNGTTVINVYYSRMVFTVNMNLNKKDAYIEKDGEKYTYGTKNYTFSAKYEQDIRDVFPLDRQVTTTDNTVIDGWQILAANSVLGKTETPHSAVAVYSEYLIPPGYKNPATRTSLLTAQWMGINQARYMTRHSYFALTAEEEAALAESGATVVPITKGKFPCPADPDAPHEYVSYGGSTYKVNLDYAMPGYDLKSRGSAASYEWGEPTGTKKLHYELAKNSDNSLAVLYMLYDRKDISITLNAMNGTVGGGASKTETKNILFGNNVRGALEKAYGGQLPEAAPSDPLQTFMGWYLDSSFETELTDTLTMPSGGLTLYARYERGTHTATFYSKVGGAAVDSAVVGGGKQAVASSVYTVGSPYDGLGEFIGWGAFLPGTQVLQPYNFSAAVNDNIELYGLWKTDNFILTYDKNGGIGTAPADSTPYKLDVLAPIKDAGLTGPLGETFIGWQAGGSGAVYYPGSHIVIKGDTKLAAVYAKSTDTLISITYHANYPGSSATTTQNNVLAHTAMVPRGADTFARNGYVLMGWSLKPGDANRVEYPFNQAFTAAGQDMNLYAVWEKEERYTVTFKIADGQEPYGYLNTQGQSSVIIDDIIKNSVFANVVAFPDAIANDGYRFTGWTPAAKPMYVQKNLEFTATFTAVYLVTFDENGGDTQAAPAIKEVVAPETAIDSLPTPPTRAGYTFAGWNTQADGTGRAFTAATAVSSNITVYAQWTAVPAIYSNTYTVTYDRNGGETEASPAIHAVTAPDTSISALPAPPTRTAHVFSGWNTQADGRGGKFTAATQVNADITVYAQWAPLPYQLTFDLNDAPGEAPQPQSLTYGGKAAAVTEPLWTGYAFLGWNLLADGSGEYWNFDTNAMPANNVTLYAIWQPDSILVGGTTTESTGTGTPEAPVTDAEAEAIPPAETAPQQGIETEGPGQAASALTPGSEETGPESTTIGDNPVPLFGEENTPVWALLNLILMAAGSVLGIAMLITALVRRRKKDDGRNAEGAKDVSSEEENKQRRTRLAWLIGSIGLAIAGVIAFMLTENMENLMVWMDSFTPMMIIIAAAEAVCAVFSVKRRKKDSDKEGEKPAPTDGSYSRQGA